MTFVKAMALVAMAFLWTGSQIPIYLYGAVPPYSTLLISFTSLGSSFNGVQSMEILEALIVGHGSLWVIFLHWDPFARSLAVYQICSAGAMLLSVELRCSLWATLLHRLRIA